MRTYGIGKHIMPEALRRKPEAGLRYAIGNALSGNGEPVWGYPTKQAALRAYAAWCDTLRLTFWKAIAGEWVQDNS